MYNLGIVSTKCSGLFAFALFCILPAASIRLAAQSTQHAPTIRVQVDSVFIPVVVRDARGHTANDLTKDDFQIFDNGKLVSDFGFAVEKRAEIYSTRAAESPAPQRTSRIIRPSCPP